MVDVTDVKSIKLTKELEPFLGDYYKALIKRAYDNLLGESEFLCFKRFIDLYSSGKYKFAAKAMARTFKLLSLLIYVDEDGKASRLKLYPVQKFILCGIFGLRYPDGRYLINKARIYMARRNGKSFLLSGIAHNLMLASKFRNELIILASCKGQNATICFNEFCKFVDNDPNLKELYKQLSRAGGWARALPTGNRLEVFKTGGASKSSLDGFTNKVAIIDEAALCDEIITKTISDGQAHFKDSLLVEISTAQFDIGGDNHKNWIATRKALYEEELPDNVFLFLCEPDEDDLAGKDYSVMRVWGKANPVLLFEENGYTVKEHIKRKYTQAAKEAMAEKGFALQNFVTKQCNCWYSSENKSLCTWEQLQACQDSYSFEDVINAGYKSWYLGLDFSQVNDLSSVAFVCYVGVDETGKLLGPEETPARYRLFIHVLSWLPAGKLTQHVDKDKFCYYDYVGSEVFLCTGANGENIDIYQIYQEVNKIREEYDLNFICITADPYNVAGVQDAFANIADCFILQNQSPKALSQYIEALGKSFKDGEVMLNGEVLLQKAITNSVMLRNTTGYYSIEKVGLKANADIRIDPLDATLDAFIAAYIDHSKSVLQGAAAIDDWLNDF